MENAKAHHVRKTEMDNTTPYTFKFRTAEVITESPKNNAIAIRKIVEE